MITVVDTDALLGLFIPQDVHHIHALELLERLVHLEAETLILPTTLSEFALLATSRIGMRQTKAAVDELTGTSFVTCDIAEADTKEALTLYKAQTSKEESLFDCYVMAVAKKLAADCIFSFDRGYRKNGHMLVEDFLTGEKR